MPDIIEIITFLIGIAGTVYAVWESIKRKKIEDIVDRNIDALEESVKLQGRRGEYAKQNIDKLVQLIGLIPDESKRNEAIEAAAFGRGDATSSQDLPTALLGHLKALRMRKSKKT